ncbi:MAG TPA: alpha-amylase family glycosyl hydrolase [Fibrobacteria bacterium]|nr:alpha-amylase family glycosyl hydrolase [Fibrobacteria bacterium]
MRNEDRIIYHIYPLGALGVLEAKATLREPAPLARIDDWIPVMERIGANTLLLGPVSMSATHGYDVLDLDRVDPRLGDAQDLSELSKRLRERGIELVLDAVLNHVGRGHPLVQEVAADPTSPRADWIAGFDPRSKKGGLPFGYRDWNGHEELVKLDTGNHQVRRWLIESVLGWIDAFGIRGIRVDAADCLDRQFLELLAHRCHERDEEFLLLGEALPGETCATLLEAGLDSATNYEGYKSLWSSHNDANYHELSWTLERLFGATGLCRGHLLQTFADNHDVDRVASRLVDQNHLYPLHGLLFSMPGIPSIYAGSEYGIHGRRTNADDRSLRPALDPRLLAGMAPHPDLPAAIARFAEARRTCAALRRGTYRTLRVESRRFAFLRQSPGQAVVVAVNASGNREALPVHLEECSGRILRDLLDPDYRLPIPQTGNATIDIPPNWIRFLATD